MLTSQKVENSETRKVGPMVGKKDYTRKIQDKNEHKMDIIVLSELSRTQRP
jgi:hypothetical protein